MAYHVVPRTVFVGTVRGEGESQDKFLPVRVGQLREQVIGQNGLRFLLPYCDPGYFPGILAVIEDAGVCHMIDRIDVALNSEQVLGVSHVRLQVIGAWRQRV